MSNFVNLLTKNQVLSTYAFAGVTRDNIPGKKADLYLRIPGAKVTLHISKTNLKSAYRKVLYACEHVPDPLTRDEHERVVSYAPGDGDLSFTVIDRETRICGPFCSPTQAECEALLLPGWELYNDGPYWRARRLPSPLEVGC
jgi:hypothetical protein